MSVRAIVQSRYVSKIKQCQKGRLKTRQCVGLH
jgi:hypothetical protein